MLKLLDQRIRIQTHLSWTADADLIMGISADFVNGSLTQGTSVVRRKYCRLLLVLLCG